DLGRTYQDVIRVNSQSGKGGVAYVLANKFGFQLPRWLQIEFSRVVQDAAEETGGEIQPDRIWELFNRHYFDKDKVISLQNYSIERNEAGEVFSGAITYFGKSMQVRGQGNGVLDALVQGLQKVVQIDFEVMDYGEHALSQGADAEAVTYIQIKSQGKRYTGIAISEDIVSSSLDALMSAASQLLTKQKAAA
ncbi:MAG: 2-isopropylmalate synthase, partial [Gammaproteobacteria bacterium]|nr:2-isopropylmalate synthase [Gammaproteobacteria bacterium]